MTSIIGGPGLPVILRALPKLVFGPFLVCFLPTVVARQLPPSVPTELFLDLPAPLRILLSCGVFVLARQAIARYSRYRDMRNFGPDVVEVPALEMKLPWNLDFIPIAIDGQLNDYSSLLWGRYAEKYGNTYNYGILGETQIMTTEPENIKAILSTDFGSFEKGHEFRDKMFSVLGKGVFNSDGEIWKFHRTMTRPYFSRDRISHFDLFGRHSDKAISKLLDRLSEPSQPPVDFQDIVARFTLDAATEFLFGKDIRSLDSPLPYPHAPPTDKSASFALAFGRAQEGLAIRLGLAVLWPLFELFHDRTREDMRVIEAYVKPILREKLEEKKKNGTITKKDDAEDGGDTLLDHLVQHTDGE
ncbi:cytochrome P450 family protein [Ceratobasidium sp. AG-Ba]|nr:cytochrome P450 family protein [Ceratobasidium sp. AG-Ba]